MITINEVYLPIAKGSKGLIEHGKQLRKFQKEFIDCVNEGGADVIQLIAPTGAGKTKCFEYLLRQGCKVLLLYPTNALIKSQLERFINAGFTAINLSSKKLTKHKYERAQELKGIINRHDIIVSNPDIFQAVFGGMYVNPEEDLIQAFHQFSFVIYDEFHAYSEFELSGILTQIAMFENMSGCRVILSSATPKFDALELLSSVRIERERRGLVMKDVVAVPCKPKSGYKPIRHEIKVQFLCGKIIKHAAEVVSVLKSALETGVIDPSRGEPQALFIFDSVRDCNLFYNFLFEYCSEIYQLTEKDNGYDTNQTGTVCDFTKPILISTNKSELGLDYPTKLLFMEDGFSYDSFVQRFGRVGRNAPGMCYIFTKKEVNPLFEAERCIEYTEFLENIKHATAEYNLVMRKVRILFTFRQAIAIWEYKKRREDLMGYFAVPDTTDTKYSYKLWLSMFATLDKLTSTGLRNDQLSILYQLVNDLAEACKSLRGRSLSKPVVYQRGHELRQTTYDMLRVLNTVPVRVEYKGNELVLHEAESLLPGPFIQTVKIPYFPGYLNYQTLDKQFRDNIESVLNEALVVCSKKQRSLLRFCIISLYSAIDANRFVIPQKLVMWNDEVVDLER